VVVLLATSVVETRPAPAAAETRQEAAVTAPQQEPATAEARPEVVAVVQQEPALTGSSQATVVEIPDDDVPPPGWDQWVSLPAPATEPQAGALVIRRDDHMVAGGSRHGVEASSSHTAPTGSRGPAADPGQGQERVDAPSPIFVDAQEEQQLWEELRDHGASLNRVLNEALRIHGGPAWRVFQVRRRCFFLFFDLVVFVFAFVVWHSWVSFADGRSWSTAPATGTVPSTR
jgi:hypothetical protein